MQPPQELLLYLSECCQCVVRCIIFSVVLRSIYCQPRKPTRMMAARFNRRSRANKIELDRKIWFLRVRVETREEATSRNTRYRIGTLFCSVYFDRVRTSTCSCYKARAAISLTVFRDLLYKIWILHLTRESLSIFVCNSLNIYVTSVCVHFAIDIGSMYIYIHICYSGPFFNKVIFRSI